MRKKIFFCRLKVPEDFCTDSDPHQNPYQNVTDPEHWLICLNATTKLLSTSFIFFRPWAIPWKKCRYTGSLLTHGKR
jgi:hypothetical protein